MAPDRPMTPGADPERELRDVAYSDGSPAQKLDLHLPRGGGPFPVVLWVHGGAWHSGDKALGARAPQRRLLERGWAIASVNYRLSSEATFPAQLLDVRAAVRWLHAHAPALGLDAGRMAAWGASAGGHLAALLGTTGGIPALEGEPAGAPCRVRAVVDWFGPTDFLRMDAQAAANGCPPYDGAGHAAPDSPESRLLGAPIAERPDRVRAANPITYIDDGAPPFLIQHGRGDCVVPWQQSELLRDALLPVLGPGRVRLTLLDAGHGGSAFHAAANLDEVESFLARHLA
jgi:acetyl esterase/lipase